MATFELPGDLTFNRGPVQDPNAYAKASECASWLLLTGDTFASTPEGISYEQVREAVPHSRNVVSDPPVVLDLDLARQHVRALDQLPRPTLVSCRAGPRASAVAYMYSGLKVGANPEDVIAAGQRDEAPFCRSEQTMDWVRACIETLGGET